MEDHNYRPLPPLYDSWFIIAMAFAVVLSILLEISGLEKRLVHAIQPMLPDWFPAFNMLMAPILVALPTMRLKLRIRVEVRLGLLVLMLCCFSLYRLSFDKHPMVTLLIGVFVYVELFWLIPKWNSRHPISSELRV